GCGAQPAGRRVCRDRRARRGGDPHILRRGSAQARGRVPGGGACRSRAILAGGRASSAPGRHRRPGLTPPSVAGLTFLSALPAVERRDRDTNARAHGRCPGRCGPVRQAMPIRLDSRAPDFAQRFRALLATKREASADVENAVRAIIADVAARGDHALIELTRTFDRLDLDQAGLRVTADEIAGAHASCDRRALDALAFARDRIEAYHRRQLPKDDRFTDALGVELGSRWTAIESVGLYVPGGTAASPSSVLMNAVPAKVAGVPRLVMVVPAPDGKLSPLVLAAAR